MLEKYGDQGQVAPDDWIVRELVHGAEELIESSKRGVCVETVRDIYAAAVKRATSSEDFDYIACSVSDDKYLGDKEWGRELHCAALEKAENATDLARTAQALADEKLIGDAEWSRKVYQEAIDLAETAGQLMYIASSMADEDGLGDQSWARKTIHRAEKLVDSVNGPNGMINLAWNASDLEDGNSVVEGILHRAVEYASNSYELCWIIVAAYNYGVDMAEEWLTEVYDRAMGMAEDERAKEQINKSIKYHLDRLADSHPTRFPTIDGRYRPYFEKRECPVCGKSGMHEPYSFAYLGAGSNCMEKGVTSYLQLRLHGAHDIISENDYYAGKDGGTTVVNDFENGAFEMYFCSIACLREFLNRCVDDFEASISPYLGCSD